MTLDSTGLTTPRLADLRASVRAALRGSLGAGVQLGQTRVMGRLVDVLCVPIADISGITQAIYDAFDPDGAEGTLQDNLCALVGVTRIAARATVATLTGTASGSGTIPAGSRFRVPGGPVFEATEDVAFTAGSFTFDVIAQEVGPQEADAATITALVDVVSGLASVTNAAAATPGRDVERDEELRVRREASLRIVGSGTDQAMRARILEVDGVDAAVVISNRNLTTDGNGIPGKAFRAVVWPTPASSDPIWQAIWDTMPGGILANGAVSGSAIDSQGNAQPVAYSVASEVEIHVEVVVEVDETVWPVDGPDQVKAAVESAFADLSIGDDVRIYRVTAAVAAAAIPGIESLIVRAKAGSAPGPSDTTNLSISITQIATIDVANIDVTVS
jgi:uncharacterized phage protein gp47/JayE